MWWSGKFSLIRGYLGRELNEEKVGAMVHSGGEGRASHKGPAVGNTQHVQGSVRA